MTTKTKTKAPRAKKVTEAMTNGRAPHEVSLNLYDRLMIISTLNTPTVSLKEARRREKLYRALRPTTQERDRFGITEPRPGKYQWPTRLGHLIETAEETPVEMSATQHELVRDAYGLLIETKQINLNLDVLGLLGKFLSESEIDELVEEMEEDEPEEAE